jgi:hypothetical protein
LLTDALWALSGRELQRKIKSHRLPKENHIQLSKAATLDTRSRVADRLSELSSNRPFLQQPPFPPATALSSSNRPFLQQPPFPPATALSLQRFSPFCHPERTRISCLRLSPATTDVVLSKENHTKLTDAATLNRKSGEGEGSAVRHSCAPPLPAHNLQQPQRKFGRSREICSCADLSWKCFSTGDYRSGEPRLRDSSTVRKPYQS